MTFTAAGGAPPYRWFQQGGTLPAGLILSPSGVLSGTPTLTCTGCLFFVTVDDAAAAFTTATFSIVVNAPSLSITTLSPLPSGSVDQPYLYTLHATGGDPSFSYAWSLVPGGLPRGLNLSPNGVVLGTPVEPGTFSTAVESNRHDVFRERIIAAGASGDSCEFSCGNRQPGRAC